MNIQPSSSELVRSVKNDQNPYHEIAKGMDGEFMKFLLEKMRGNESLDQSDSSDLDFYKSLLDTEYAKSYVDQNSGKGLQELILNQIEPNHSQHALKLNPQKSIEIYKKF
jgi:Rod binding domain-containing protein